MDGVSQHMYDLGTLYVGAKHTTKLNTHPEMVCTSSPFIAMLIMAVVLRRRHFADLEGDLYCDDEVYGERDDGDALSNDWVERGKEVKDKGAHQREVLVDELDLDEIIDDCEIV